MAVGCLHPVQAASLVGEPLFFRPQARSPLGRQAAGKRVGATPRTPPTEWAGKYVWEPASAGRRLAWPPDRAGDVPEAHTRPRSGRRKAVTEGQWGAPQAEGAGAPSGA